MVFFDRLKAFCEPELLTQSRIHPLRHFGPEVYVKREDESGFGISGPKKRKYASLIPFLENNNIKEVILIGGMRSNHIASFLQLLRERGIGASLMLKRGHHPAPSGNALLTRLLSDPERITWIEAEAWPYVEALAMERAEAAAQPVYVIPEGGSCLPALPGACTLMADICRNEAESGLAFEHIWIDSGTGFTAAALALMNQQLGRTSQIHVVLTAGDEAFFQEKLQEARGWFNDTFPISLPLPHPLLHFPPTARSFGSVNATVLRETLRLAREEGLITDPVYTSKLFLTARTVIAQRGLSGKNLIIHSGGGSGLFGFGEKMEHLSLV